MYSDSHQLHQYQQTTQSPRILIELNEHKQIHTTYDVGNSGQAQHIWRS